MAFLVFEGLDGSGKSSLMTAFEDWLSKRKMQFVRTREPGGTILGDEIREIILKHSDESPTPRTELLLYEASRAQHVDRVINPALSGGKWVLCDRFTASSIAFQAGGRAIPISWVEKLNDFATNSLNPDLTILLDLSVEESRRRRRNRNGQPTSEDRIESESDLFHEKVRQSFLIQAQQSPHCWLVLDASQSIENLLKKLIEHLDQSDLFSGKLKP